jgi:hypothetical protein
MPVMHLLAKKQCCICHIGGWIFRSPTNGTWITKPPSRCPNGHGLGSNQVLVERVSSRTSYGRHFAEASPRSGCGVSVMPVGDCGVDLGDQIRHIAADRRRRFRVG